METTWYVEPMTELSSEGRDKKNLLEGMTLDLKPKGLGEAT